MLPNADHQDKHNSLSRAPRTEDQDTIAALERQVAALQERNSTLASELRVERDRFLAILEGLPAFVYIQRPDRTIRYANKFFRETFGEICGRRCHQIFDNHCGDDTCDDCPLEVVLRDNHAHVAERSYIPGRTHLVYRHPFNDADGSDNILAMGIDITDRSRMESQLKTAMLEAESANKAKSEFLANMSHEIRTPLNGVLGMLQLLQETELDEEQADLADTALASGKGLLTVINDILDLSRMEAGRIPLEDSRFEVRQVIRTVTRTFERHASDLGLVLNCDIHESVPTHVVGDAGRLRQILFNIVGNSIKFTREGSITVEVERILGLTPDDRIRLLFTLRDTGIGIPNDKIDSVFQAFTQVDGSFTRKFDGSGLGLHIVQRLVQTMGGSMSMDSELGNGTTCYICLEFGTAAMSKVPIFSPTGKGFPGAEIAPRILVAEDNRVNQLMTLRWLDLMGFKAVAVDNGIRVVEKLREEIFDCVLMDIQMPELDGMEATKAIRGGAAGRHNKDIPIIACTAHAMQGDRERFLDVGLNSYLAKPFDKAQLSEILAETLGSFYVSGSFDSRSKVPSPS